MKITIFLNPVIALSIVDFDMFEDSSEVITNFKLIEKEKLINYSDDIELVFVELPKFKKELDELVDIKDQWLYFVKNAGSLEYIPKNIAKEVKKALENANEANMSKDELEAQHKRKEFISVHKLSLLKADEDGFEKGMEKGIKKGMEKGVEKEKVNIAKNLLDAGVNLDIISQTTGLSFDEIKSIK